MINFRKTSSCRHERIMPNRSAGYCPDCGEYVENHWYISRCKCCGVKQNSRVMRGKVLTDTRYCRNCGSSAFFVEELKIVDLTNINYAVLLKQIIATKRQSIMQTWFEQNSYAQMKLLTSY